MYINRPIEDGVIQVAGNSAACENSSLSARFWAFPAPPSEPSHRSGKITHRNRRELI